MSALEPGIYQKLDGTIYWLHEDGRWTYLSPLFGEWLKVFDQPDDGSLQRYPRNLSVPQEAIDAVTSGLDTIKSKLDELIKQQE